MDDLNHIEGKAVRSIEQNNSGLNSYLIIKFTDDSKLNISGYPHGDKGVAQLDIELNQIKLEEIKNRKIANIVEEFDGQMDKLRIKFKGGGEMIVGAFNSKEDATAGLETTVYVENKKKLVAETLQENEYKDGRWGKYIMNSPQYEEEEENPEEENENKNNDMKKFVKESIDDELSINDVEYDDPEDLYGDVEGDLEDEDEYVDEPDPEDLYGDVTVSHGEKLPYQSPIVMDDYDEDDEDDSISYVSPVEAKIDNLLKTPEFSREPLEFKLKGTEEFIEGIPMAKMSGGTAALFKTISGELKKIPLSDIIIESKKYKGWVGESLEDYIGEEYYNKKKKKPLPKKGEMKMVKIDDKTSIEVPVSVSDKDAIKNYKEKQELKKGKWG